jgi:hypothetical protein
MAGEGAPGQVWEVAVRARRTSELESSVRYPRARVARSVVPGADRAEGVFLVEGARGNADARRDPLVGRGAGVTGEAESAPDGRYAVVAAGCR